MEVLEQNHQRLYLALAQDQALDPVENPLSALGRVETLPGLVLDRNVEQPQDRRDRGLELPVERQELACDFLAHLPGGVSWLDREVRPEELDDGKVVRCLPVGHRAGFEDQPALGAVGLAELPVEPRFADAGLPHDGHHLPVTGSYACERLAEVVQFGLAPHEAVQAPGRRGLET